MDNERHAREAARQDRLNDNPNFRGSAAWFEWEDAYKEQRKEDGRPYTDGAPEGCPPWG